MDTAQTIVMWLSLAILNLGTIFLLRFALTKADVPSMLAEKTIPKVLPGALGAAPPPGDPPTSFSRAAGVVGAVVLSTFFWGLANAILYNAFANPDQIKPLVDDTGKFFLAGAALFAPYAFNQLASIFKQ